MAKRISMVISALGLILISGFVSASRPVRKEAENHPQALDDQKLGVGFNIGWGDGQPWEGSVGIGVGTQPWENFLNIGWGDEQPWQGHIGIGYQAGLREDVYGVCGQVCNPRYAGSGCVDDTGYYRHDRIPYIDGPGISWIPVRQSPFNPDESFKSIEDKQH
ncbi:hypothetical protein Ancab_037899 [Ancistrocladus abbreviatus]